MTADDRVTVRCPACGRTNRVPATAAGSPRCGNCHAALPWVVDADDASFSAVAEQATIPVLVDVWAPWCGPCRMVTPAVERLAIRHAGGLKLVKLNADESPQVSGRLEVQAIPALFVLRNGHVAARRVGAAPEPDLAAWLDGALAASGAGGPEAG